VGHKDDITATVIVDRQDAIRPLREEDIIDFQGTLPRIAHIFLIRVPNAKLTPQSIGILVKIGL
jgi:hypothetical protein